jgi:hypothetical protein
MEDNWKTKVKSQLEFIDKIKQDSNPIIIMLSVFCPMLCEWLSSSVFIVSSVANHM